MKGDLTRRFLEIIEDVPRTIEDLFVLLTSPYGSSYSRIDKRLEEFHANKRQLKGLPAGDRSLNDLIYRLRRDGLIANAKIEGMKGVKITGRGKVSLARLVTRIQQALPSSRYQHSEPAATIKIVIFDIPEKERRKRRWLNVVLKNLGFTRIQKSVWIGKKKIPTKFMKDMARLRLLSYVEIFAVSKTGSLRHVT